MDSNSFWKFYLICCRDATSRLRSGKESGAVRWSWIPNDTRGWSRIFCRTPTPEVQLDHFYITLLSWEFLLNRYNFWRSEGRSWSQTFYLRLRNPGCHTWMMASISSVMIVQSNFCNRDFLTDHKFSMRLRSGEFPGQSITFKFASWRSSSLFQMKDTGQYPGIFLHHLEMSFSYLEWLFSQLDQCICVNPSYPQLA